MVSARGHLETHRIEGALIPTIVLLVPLWLAYVVGEPGAVRSFSIAILPICGLGVVRLLLRDPLVIWSPMLWFLVASTIYCGVGPLVLVYGDSEIVGYLQEYYFTDESGLARTNALNTIGIALVCIVYEIALRTISEFAEPRDQSALKPERGTATLFALIATIGYSAAFFAYLLRTWYGDSYIMPGIVFTLAELTKVALLIAVYRFVGGHRNSLALLLLCGGIEIMLAAATLMKQNVLEVVLVTFMGVYLARPSRKWLFLIVPTVLVTYWALVPVFGAARFLWGTDATIADTLMEVLAEFAFQHTGASVNQDMSWWARLCYVGPQAFAMEMYDMGLKGNTFETAITTVVPRILWADKPIITHGHEFSFLVKGVEGGGGSGPGFFGEAYWNFGWGGVVLMAVWTGIVHATMTHLNMQKIGDKDLRWLPVAYIAIKMGYRMDDWFVSVMVGSISMMLAVGSLVYGVFSVLHWGSVKRSAPDSGVQRVGLPGINKR